MLFFHSFRSLAWAVFVRGCCLIGIGWPFFDCGSGFPFLGYCTPEPTSSSGLQPSAFHHSCNITLVRVCLASVWFLDRSVLNLVFVLHILNSIYIFNVISFSNVNVAWCSSFVVVSASLFSDDFASPLNWPFLSPLLYPLVLGFLFKAVAPKTSESISIHSRRHNNYSLCFSTQFTFSIENGVPFEHLIFHRPLMDADSLSSYYLSQSSLLISCCLLATFGFLRFGVGREIRFSVFLSRVYPGVSCLSHFSGYASIFCTAE